MTSKKKSTSSKTKPAWKLVVGRRYVRKRDKQHVYIDEISSSKVTYVVLPMLVLWTTDKAGFHSKFRPLTDEEMARVSEEDRQEDEEREARAAGHRRS